MQKGDINIPNELLLKSAALLSPPVRRGTETGGDSITVSPFIHAFHNPIAAGLDAGPRRLRQLHRHSIIPGRDRRHLRYGERLSA